MSPTFERQSGTAVATAPCCPTVLLVDDDEHFRQLARTILDTAGFTVVEASDVAGCVLKLGAGFVDVIVLDIVMPGRDGIEGIQDIRQRDPEAKVITVSGARSSELYLAVSARLGADASLDKSHIFSLPALVDVILDR